MSFIDRMIKVRQAGLKDSDLVGLSADAKVVVWMEAAGYSAKQIALHLRANVAAHYILASK